MGLRDDILAVFFAGAASAAVAGVSVSPLSELPPSRHPFRSYGPQQGLETMAATQITQDPAGFLWVGTEDGVYRYDGNRFRRFGLAEGLPSSYITALSADAAGRVWAGTYAGLAFWNGERFATVGADSGFPSQAVNGLGVDRRQRIWVAGRAGLYVASPVPPESAAAVDSTGHPTLPWRGHFAVAPGWLGGEASALWTDSEHDEIYAADTRGRIGLLDGAGGWTIWNLPAAQSDEHVDALALDRRGRLWARSGRHLWLKEPGTDSFEDVSHVLPWTSTRGYLAVDRKGDLWVPTDRGLAHLEGDRWSVIGAAHGLPTEWSRGVFEDRERSLWVASLGVHRLMGKGVWESYGLAEGLPSEVVWCIWRDRGGELWVGTDRGLARATGRGWELLAGTERHAVRRIAETADGALWMAGSPVEVLRWDPAARRLTRESAGLSGKRVMSLLADRAGTLWVGTDGGGLFRRIILGGAAGSRFETVEIPGGSRDERFSHLSQDRAGRLWAAGERGLACLENGVWRRFSRQDGLRADYVSYWIETRGGDFWAVYFEPLGMDRVAFDGFRLTSRQHLDSRQGLGADKIYLAGEDRQGRLWVGTSKGVDLVYPAGVGSAGGEAVAGTRHFGTGEGLIGEDCDAMAFFDDPRGGVWIGTSSGLSHFVGGALGDPEPPRPTLISARLGQRSLHPSFAPLRVPHTEDTLEVQYSGLSFVNEDRVEHEIRLLGLEETWRPAQVRETRYTLLPAGAYRFEMRARNGKGPWSQPVALAFEIAPAWWNTLPFRLAAALALAGLFGLAVKWRLGALARRNRDLESLVGARTAELEAANSALANLSVTDPLTGLKNRRFLNLSMPQDLAQLRRQAREAGGAQAERANPDLVFFMVDLDHFKEVNDRHGHASGDHVLRQTCDILAAAIRDADPLVRWGGEEFLVVARNTRRDEAPRVAERIRASIAAHSFRLDTVTLRVTCSIGFAAFPFLPDAPDKLSWEEVVDVSDLCLYTAKRSGRNAWVGVFANPGVPPDTILSRIRQDMPSVVAANHVTVHTSRPDPATLHWA